MVIYKRDRVTIGDERNRYEYKLEHPICECCRRYVGQVHHAVPQQHRYKGEVYIIDLPWNYFTLGTWCCHDICEKHEKQYYAKGLDKISKKPWEYWNTPKDGIDADEFIERMRNWSATQGFYMPAPNEPMEWVENYIKQNSGWDI